MDDLIRTATDRKVALQRELEELNTFLRVAARLTPSGRSVASKRDVPRADSIVARTVALARERILAAGRPLPVAQLYALLVSDIEIGGKDPNATLSARLSNSHEFTSHRGLGWWPNDHPLPSLFATPDDKEAAEASHSHPAASSDHSSQEDKHAAALTEIFN